MTLFDTMQAIVCLLILPIVLPFGVMLWAAMTGRL